MLEHRQVKTDSALNGFKAIILIQSRIELFSKGKTSMYKVVLLDYSMPEMDGPAFTRELTEFCKSNGIEMPYVCCCTAYTGENF